jgi:hypothetical protein
MVDALTTLEETQEVVGEGWTVFPVRALFSQIDTVREELLEERVHPTLFNMESA